MCKPFRQRDGNTVILFMYVGTPVFPSILLKCKYTKYAEVGVYKVAFPG